jgi:hypothetical protein
MVAAERSPNLRTTVGGRLVKRSCSRKSTRRAQRRRRVVERPACSAAFVRYWIAGRYRRIDFGQLESLAGDGVGARGSSLTLERQMAPQAAPRHSFFLTTDHGPLFPRPCQEMQSPFARGANGNRSRLGRPWVMSGLSCSRSRSRSSCCGVWSRRRRDR